MMKRSIPTLLLLALLVAAAIAPVVGQALTVSTDKPTYIPGETVVVSGTAPAGSWVGIAVVSPAGKEVDYRMVQADAAGRYTVSIKLPSKLPYADWIAGEYTVYAYLGASRVATTFILSAGSRAFGKVVDARGNPVADAEILVVETGDLARSRADGSFELYTSPGTVTVRVSKPGYTRAEKTVTLALGDNDLGTIAIQPLDEVVAALSSRVAQLEEKVAQLDKTLADIGKTLQDISAAIGKLATKDDVTSAKNDILNALKPLSTDLSAVKSDVAAIKSDLAAVKGAMATKSDVEAVKTAIGDLNTAVRDVATAVKGVSDAVTAVKGDVTKVRTDVLDAVASAVNAARDAATKADDAKKSADAAKSSADAAVSGINAVKGDVAAIKSSVADTSGTVSGIYTLVIVTLVFAVIGAATSIYILLRLSKALAK
uniref:Carboxypeptidase regulatory-like domain-containing protein n=1 Tax=Ignisphaera aggregans TaxID=334771 RepID=A0A7J3I6Y9_9CREN